MSSFGKIKQGVHYNEILDILTVESISREFEKVSRPLKCCTSIFWITLYH